MKIFAVPEIEMLSFLHNSLAVIYNSSINHMNPSKTSVHWTNKIPSSKLYWRQRNRSCDLPSKNERSKKRGGRKREGCCSRDTRASKVNWNKRPCRKSVANSCRPKRIREKQRGGPVPSQWINNVVSPLVGPVEIRETVCVATFARENGTTFPKETFLVVIEAVNEGGPLARALGSALNGHKWQTNTAVGSGSTKVETSRATLSTMLSCLPQPLPLLIFLIVVRGLDIESLVTDFAIVGTTLVIRE